MEKTDMWALIAGFISAVAVILGMLVAGTIAGIGDNEIAVACIRAGGQMTDGNCTR